MRFSDDKQLDYAAAYIKPKYHTSMTCMLDIENAKMPVK